MKKQFSKKSTKPWTSRPLPKISQKQIFKPKKHTIIFKKTSHKFFNQNIF